MPRSMRQSTEVGGGVLRRLHPLWRAFE